jgi:hypothetical protein
MLEMLRFAELFIALVIVVTVVGCQEIVLAPRANGPVVVHKSGPPSHAPAHGYRHKHQTGTEFRFDSNLGVYIVEGKTDIYFHDGWFVRIRSGTWQVSASIDGQWKAQSANWVPPGLRSKHHTKKPKERGRGAANSKW